jgi:peptide/nickel transport system permease protein
MRAAASPWLRFALRRFGGLVIGLAILLVGSFLMIHLIPGDPVRSALGLEATPQLVQQARHDLHLDEPLYVQFAYYVQNAITFNFGTSITTGVPVSEILATRFPNTLRLVALGTILVLLLSVPLGMVGGALSQAGRHRRFDLLFAAATGTTIAIPEFLLATFLVFVFAVTLRWLPVAGSGDWTYYVLPAAAIAVGPTAALARIVRVETLKVLGREYILTARSKRLPSRVIYLRHAMPNLLTSALTIGGVLFAALLGGTVIVENIFAWPGLGSSVVSSILSKDYPTVQAIVLLLGAIVLVVNTVVDMVLAVLDPRSIILNT